MTTVAPFTVFLACSTLIDAIAAGLVLLAPRGEGPDGPTIGPGRAGLAAMATSASFLVKLPAFRRLGVNVFGWMNLAYVDLVVLLPAIGAVLLLAERPIVGRRPLLRLSRSTRLAAMAALAMAFVGVYASWIEPFRLRVESASLEVSDRRAGRSAIRLGVMTDLQTDRITDHERRAVDALMAQHPDLILIPGDVFQGTAEEFEANRPALRELLGRLHANGGVFLVLGDVDGPGDHLRDLIEGTDIRLLVNEVARVEVRDRRLTIGGIELNYFDDAAHRTVERLETEPGADDIRIVLAHRPDVILGMRPDSRVDLVVAGHTHGGQIVIPVFGPPMTLTDVPRSVAAGGLHRLDGNAIYVGRGVGHERGQAPRIRFLCPPEVAVVDLGAAPNAPSAHP